MKTKECTGCGMPIEPASEVSYAEGVCAVCTAKAQTAAERVAVVDGLVDLLPPVWRKLFLRSVAEGFTETESFMLLQTYILSQCPHGVRGTAS